MLKARRNFSTRYAKETIDVLLSMFGEAATAYAENVRSENPQLADDILAALADPAKAHPQHRYA